MPRFGTMCTLAVVATFAVGCGDNSGLDLEGITLAPDLEFVDFDLRAASFCRYHIEADHYHAKPRRH